MNHPLHFAVAEEVERALEGRGQLLRDPACGGMQHLPLFVGAQRGRDTLICQVDLLVLASDLVKIIVEIEESDFKPTKICGKFLQSALATHFVHDSKDKPISFSDHVHFVQVLDGSYVLKSGSRKARQAALIEQEICSRLPLKESKISNYRLFYIKGPGDQDGLRRVGEAVRQAMAG